MSRGLDKKAKEEFKKTGLSPSHAFLLYIVSKNNDFPQQKIGERFNLDPSTVTRLVYKLKNKDFDYQLSLLLFPPCFLKDKKTHRVVLFTLFIAEFNLQSICFILLLDC